MKNISACPNCSAENPLYNSTCKNCGAFIKDRIVNVDLWNTVALLIESPVNAFTKIIEAEHKNFIVFILLLAVFKFWVDANFIYLAVFRTDPSLSRFVAEYFVIGGLIIGLLLLISFAVKMITKSKLGTRIKDVFSIMIYSLLPHFFAAVILFTVELIIFGSYLFSVNPSPFMLKENAAIVLSIFEGMIILWGILLSVFSFYALTRSRTFSIIAGVLMNLVLFGTIFLSSLYILNK